MLIVRSALLLLLVVPAAASAQSMNAEVFHKRASALMSKGPFAMMSGDLKPVMREGQAAAAKARETRLAMVKAGQKPRYCPPEGARGMGSNEFIKGLSAIPAGDRTKIDMTEATTRILARKFPCPA